MKRHRIPLSDRAIAGKLLLRLANHPESHHDGFCLSWAYDYDVEFLGAVKADIGWDGPDDPFVNRLRRICRHLENWGVLAGRISSCHAEYLGEPRTLKSYRFGDPGYAWRLAPDKNPHYKPMGKVETELKILLDRCYPDEEE